MTRPPWIGFAVSLACHAGVLALVLVVAWRVELLPALIVDLRDGFISGGAAIRSLVSESHPARGASSSPAASRSARPKSETPPVTPEPPTPPRVAAPTPPIAPAGTSPPPAPVVEAPPPQLVALPATTDGLPREPLSLPSAREPVGSSAPGSLSPAATTESRAQAGRGRDGGVAGSGVREAGRAGGGSASGSGATPGPEGRDVAGGVSGSSVASATTGEGSGVGAEYGPYLTALRQRIQQSLRYPPSARRRGVSGTVNVEILILASGAIGGVTLVDSSTHSVLDTAALEAIRSLPRMPLPPELPARALRVRVPVVFEMRSP